MPPAVPSREDAAIRLGIGDGGIEEGEEDEETMKRYPWDECPRALRQREISQSWLDEEIVEPLTEK